MEVPGVYWLSTEEMDTAKRFQILNEADSIPQPTNILVKGMNPIIHPSAMCK